MARRGGVSLSKKECVVCNAEFEAKTSEKTCSKSCADIQRRRKKKEWLVKNKKKGSDTKKRWKDKTRSVRNMYDDVSKQGRQCIICQKEYVGHFQSKTCSDECRLTHRRQRKRDLAPPKVEVSKDCEHCNEPFRVLHKNHKFCSDVCSHRNRNPVKPKYIERNCEECNRPFEAYLRRGKYCSTTCSNKVRHRIWITNNPIQPKDCLTCGKTFTPYSRAGDIKYCCNKCLKQHWVDSNPMVRLSARFRLGIRGVISGRNKKSNVWEYLSFTPEELMSQFESRFTDGMSWDNMDEWHIDHIRPVASFNFDSTEHPDFKKSWALNNLQPLWAADNMSKGDKWDGVVNA